MTILAVDTSEANCSAALVRAGVVLASRSDAIGRGHAEYLLPMIEALLRDAGTGYPDVSRIAVTTGPGTFTGLRIGLSVARGLALGLGVPCVGLSGLQVLAAGEGGGGVVHAVIAGRGGQAYHQAFDTAGAGELPSVLTDAGSLDMEEIVHRIREIPGRVVGSGSRLLPEEHQGAALSAGVIDPAVLGQLAEGLDPAGYPPEPLYLRQADAAKAKPLLPVAP